MNAITGGTGMLGSMMASVMEDVAILGRYRIDATDPDLEVLEGYDWIINCIGVVKPFCEDVENAIRVNALFPCYLPSNTIQIATDCVYDGSKGNYVETDLHNATDVYGKTKSLGESPFIKNLRCSIIGPEQKNHLSLLDWFLAQEGEVNGFTNHLWNGITTYHFAKIVQGIIRDKIQLPTLQHIVPKDVVTKYDLLKIIAETYGKDIKINPTEADVVVDRTLSSNDPFMNQLLWRSAGYDEPPTVKQMVKELHDYTYSMRNKA